MLWGGVGVGILTTVGFVASVYSAPQHIRTASRNAPKVPAGCPSLAAVALPGVASVGTALLATMTLFGGSAVIAILDPASILLPPWQLLRNWCLAPLNEEILFRFVNSAILLHFGGSYWSLYLIGPMLFWVAHFHHGWGLLQSGQFSTIQVVVSTACTCLYTGLFGSFAAYLMTATGSIWSAVLCHMVCNVFGLPDVSWLSPSSALYKHRTVIGAIYLLGIIGFVVIAINLRATFELLSGVESPSSALSCWADANLA